MKPLWGLLNHYLPSSTLSSQESGMYWAFVSSLILFQQSSLLQYFGNLLHLGAAVASQIHESIPYKIQIENQFYHLKHLKQRHHLFLYWSSFLEESPDSCHWKLYPLMLAFCLYPKLNYMHPHKIKSQSSHNQSLYPTAAKHLSFRLW